MNTYGRFQKHGVEGVAEVMVGLHKNGRYEGKLTSSFRGPLELSFESALHPKQPQNIEQELKYAKRAEKVWTAADYEHAGVTNSHVATQAQYGDGVLVCCKGHETTLKHYIGRFPVGHVVCGRCDHVLCKDCHTSDILTPYNADVAAIMKASSTNDKTEGRLVRVCGECGLSHRAMASKKGYSFAETCACGRTLTGGLLYFIGNVWEFRRNPVGRTQWVRNQRMEAEYARRSGQQRPNMSTHEMVNAAQVSAVQQGYSRSVSWSSPRSSLLSPDKGPGLRRSNASRRTRSEFSVVDQRARRPY